MTTFINLTPHAINIHNENKEEISKIEPSGSIARVSTETTKVGVLGGVPIFSRKTGEVTGLPPATDGVFYIVSGMVAASVQRSDVFSPGNLLRDDNGRPVGCIGLFE